MNKTYTSLEYYEILNILSGLALSDGAKGKIEELSPSLSLRKVLANIKETSEAKDLIEKLGNPPIAIMSKIDKHIDEAVKGGMLNCEELIYLSQFINSCGKLKKYLEKGEKIDIELAYMGSSFYDLLFISAEIENAIQNGRIDDRASKELREIRKKIDILKNKIKEKLNVILKNNKTYFADNFISNRNGRLTLPVKKEYKNKVSGIIIDTSQTGETVFIEPDIARKFQDEIIGMEIDEDNEVRRILYVLSEIIAQNEKLLKLNIENMENLDFIFAKGKLSLKMQGNPPQITGDNTIKIINGRHPLLDQNNVVPLNFEIGNSTTGVIITGPNTGGKTVALKTVGLFSLMAQSGLHIPADTGSAICLRDKVLCDIGDGQSISENLSTFSAHMSNIINILNESTGDSLVLLDELGSGTDPAEGMGLAVAILEELSKMGCLTMATTHYPEIKHFAENTNGFINAKMAFHKESLQPLYYLEIGKAGESCALYIAKKLGLAEHMLERAYQVVYSQEKVDNSNIFIKNEFKENNLMQNKGVNKKSKLDREIDAKPKPAYINKFKIGDSVIIFPKKELGVICRLSDEKGNFGVLLKDDKIEVNHKRLKLYVSAEELYPVDYDFSVIFDSVENRKARKLIEKGHGEGIVIDLD